MRRNTNSLRKSVFVIVMCIAFCFLLLPVLPAQTWTMPVDGRVYAGNEKLTGAIVTLYKNGQQQQQVVTISNGRFSFELPPNAEYLISITKPGYVTKKFKIVTANVPADRAEAGGFNPFEPDVTLFEMPSAPEISKRVEAILSQPIAIYQFIPSEGNFNYDEKYTQVIQNKLAELAQLQKQAEKEMEEKVKNAALEAQKQLEIDKKYKAAVAKGDASFNAKDYSTAKTGYAEASGIKPGEQYPKTKLAEINKLLAEMSKAGELDKQYKDLITKADDFFLQKNYASAKGSYSDASSLKSSEQYPKTKITEIDKLLSRAEADKQKEQQYKDAIAKADAVFGAKDYAGAKSSYIQASGIKPAEQYPKTKLAEIDKLLSGAEADKQKEQQYKDLITKADNFFLQKNYASAKGSYSDASSLKSSEQYPKTKIAEIDKILKDLAAKNASDKSVNENYQAAIIRGDFGFSGKNYANAKTAYNEALTYKPNEQYPKDKLAEIEKIEKDRIAAQAQQDKNLRYNQAIGKADNLFKNKYYVPAKGSYEEALTYKPDEKYPKDRITQIETLLKNALATQNIKKEPKKTAPVISEEEKKKVYQSELRAKYPNGVTEEEFSDNGKTILRRVVIKDDFAGVYMKVTHNWGGVYYFRDNSPITESVFENETK